MNNDYVQRFVGKDEISPVAAEIKKNIEGMASSVDDVNKAVGKTSGTMDKAKKSVAEFGNEVKSVGSKTDVINKLSLKFEKMEATLKPTKQSIRQLTQMMAELNYAGLGQTELYSQIAKEVGQLKDAYADAAQSAKAFANDELAIATAAQSLQLMTGAFASVTAGMQLFGADTQKVAEAQKKLQVAIAAVNGAMAIANTLNKNSTMMTALQGAWTKAKIAVQAKELAAQKALNIETLKGAAAKSADAVATGADTASKTANAAATTAAAGAQMSLNTAIAMGKLLLGDWTVILTAVTTLVGGWAIGQALLGDSTDDATDELKKQNEELERFKNTVTSTYAELMTKYDKLRREWRSLSNEHERNEWIKKNKTEIESLTSSVNDLTSAENFFIKNTQNVAESFRLRAQAAAESQKMQSLYVKQLELMDAASNPDVYKGHRITPQQYNSMPNHIKALLDNPEVADKSYRSLAVHNTGGSLSGPKTLEGYTLKEGLNPAVIANLRANGVYSSQLLSILEQQKQNDYEINKLSNSLSWNATRANQLNPVGGTTTTPTTTTSTTTNKATKETEKQLTILQQLESEVRKYQTMLGNIDLSMPWAADEIQMVKEQLKKAEKDLKDYKISVGLEAAPPDEGSKTHIKNLIAEYDKQLNEKNLTVEARVEIESKKEELQAQLDKIDHNGQELTIKAKVEPVSGKEWNLTGSYENAKKNANTVKYQYEIGMIGAESAKSQIAEINSEIAKLNLENGTNLKPIEIDFIPTGFDKLKEGFDAVESGVNSIDGLAKSFDKLTDGLNGSANAWETFMNVMSLASSLIQTYEGITTAIETFKNVKAVADVADTGKKTAEVAANKALTKSNIELAASQIYLAHSSIPVLGAAYATSQVSIMEATMKSLAALEMFYNGGVVGGSYKEHPVLAHRGEVILNERQQNNVMDIANRRAIWTEQATRDRVIGRIRGTDIELVMKNLSKQKSRAGIEIEIR